MKFALHNYGGKAVKFYTVEAQDVTPDPQAAATSPSHHIAILDVSGSMWGDIDSVKNIIEKVFTAEEFNDPAMKISLLTYSSNGDCRVHFEKVTVEDVLAPNSPHIAEIRNLRVRGLTGMSQALVTAEKLIDDAEVTCISLHTDGYANDPSPYAEAQSIVKAVEALEKHPNAFCNTVGYRSYCDFALLAAISNRLSGKSMQAANAREVYKALHDTQTLLAGQMSPVIEAGIGQFDFIAFVSKKGEKVLGGTSSLTVRGLSGDDDATIYRYKAVDEQTYAVAPGPVCDGLTNPTPLLAFCRANIALGNLNVAKFAMVSTKLGSLLDKHSRALVAAEVVEMSSDVEAFLYDKVSESLRADYGLGETGPSVLELLSQLNTFRSSLRVNVRDLAANYQRRGLKRVTGTRNDKGEIEPPTHKLQTPRDNTAVQVSGIDINRDTATANIRLVEDGTLIETAGGTPVEEVAGIKLDLKSYHNYTLVGDGRINVPVLPIRTSDKRCFAMLKDMGLVTGDFDPSAQYNLDLSKMPLVDYDQDFGDMPSDVADELAELTVLQKILSGLTAGESEALTAEQIAALKECYISPALYFSPPTTVPYADLAVALAQGEVDTYLSYKVKIGTPDITNVSKLASGNAYLQRRFTLTGADGSEVAKPTLKDWWADGNTWGIKSLSARTKLTPVDDVSYPIYEGFLGLGDTGALKDVLLAAHLEPNTFMDALSGGMDRDEALAVFKDALRKTDNAIDVMYEHHVCPLAFYVGATGLVPDNFGAAMTADQLTEKYPNVSLAKAEKEGTFYQVPGTDMILGVFVQAEHFSTERGLEAAKALSE
jgi:hypothetical protein